MELTEQLWLLKQIYSGDNRYYNSETNRFEYRIPTAVSAEQQRALEQAGRTPNRMCCLEHDEAIRELRSLADAWTLSEAADAFIAGLWSAPFLWQCALPAKVMAAVMPLHAHTPYGGSADTCTVCGFRNGPVDATLSWYRRMTGSTPLDGDPAGYVLALREMRDAGGRPVPTEYDRWTFRAIVTAIRQAPPKTRYSKMREILYKRKLLPAADKWVYSSLLEVLALMGILDTKEHPGMAARYTTYAQRDQRPSVRVEVQAPLAWWNSSAGINAVALNRLFSQFDTSPVDWEHRPEPMPPEAKTMVGSLKGRRLPRPRVPKSPDAEFTSAGRQI